VACVPTTLVADPGDIVTSQCTVSSISGFSAPVTLSCALPPAVATCVVMPSVVTPPPGGSIIATLEVVTFPTPSTAGCHAMSVTGTSGSLSHVQSLRLDVRNAGTPSC
jgi:hypothetical protein